MKSGTGELAEGEPAIAQGGKRGQAMQRLQVGAAGVLGIVMLIGLVSVIENRAQVTEANSVPEAASTTAPGDAAPQSDPLVEAGVVPDLPATPTPTASAPPPVLLEEGSGQAAERAEPVVR
ncbi:hypothetical protein [Qipengyuania spongiae]|uniref:SPOR domain-containing protein n=1 Tax=Qipengyuania spongiae TaxID=2909673 RepID=A0ABY5T136_9SPHN|nr:hypothetical protein [Qipengyuania spongiae]UVI40477.1 hypothetical protein L1F33_05905 [Qipengyuania spongiae]